MTTSIITTGAIARSNTPTMSSLEIARLTDKTHNNVLRDIRNVLIQAEIDLLRFEQIEKFANNRTRVVYNLPRLECDLIVSGYSVKYRWSIIQRWHELEKQAAQRSFPSTTLLPVEQIKELQIRLDRLSNLFNPLSQPFGDVTDISRLLRGRCPRLNKPVPSYVNVLDTSAEIHENWPTWKFHVSPAKKLAPKHELEEV
ncbi:MAG: phage regulatory protein, rha family [Glomeribacter sp. 1016415]|nr:phage regulatory protein, rha family [Glomeribacter sp. 1016415]